MTEQTTIALIGSAGLVLAAFMSVIIAMLNRTRQHARATRDQVENSHTTNLREESDRRHSENTTRLVNLQVNVAHILGILTDHGDQIIDNTIKIADLDKRVSDTNPKKE
jgi:Mg2+/citrate symporter